MLTFKDYESGQEYTTEKLNSRHFSDDFLQDLVKRSDSHYAGKDPIKLYCSCRNPDSQDENFDWDSIRYSIHRNNYGTFFPRPYRNNQGAGHAENCLKNPKNQKYRVLNPAYSENEQEGKNVRTLINFSTPARKRNFEPVQRCSRKIPPSSNEERRGMVRSAHELFCLKSEIFFHDTALHGHYEYLNGSDTPTLCRNPIQLRHGLCDKILNYDIKIGKNPQTAIDRPMSSYTLATDGFSFLYDVVTGIYDKALDWGDDYFVRVFVGKRAYNIPVWFYRTLMSRFSGSYSGRQLEYNSQKYKLILAGSFSQNSEQDLCLNKGTFIMVSPQYGMISESIHEARFYDMAFDCLTKPINNSYIKRYKHVTFFKPYLFMPGGIYDGKGLPDGILQSLKTGRQCVIEIYGSQDATYLKQRAKKEAWLNAHKAEYDYFYWDVTNLNVSFEEVAENFAEIVEQYCNF